MQSWITLGHFQKQPALKCANKNVKIKLKEYCFQSKGPSKEFTETGTAQDNIFTH